MARYRKLGRTSSHRDLMLRNLTTSLLEKGRIETTETRAKEARRQVEKMITLAKRGDLHARRQAAAYVTSPAVVQSLFNEIGPKYADKNGGYTRMYKLGPRRGDASMMVIIELV
ncbi:50S ribosomal protein L17 [Fusibacter sp. JL216-2]|uniref:50S ribosomal protein L17 n=1 Tax=Fusibacter sp. JL216-2 TaxID=3071453 RepID=UPI003D33E919|tara:strand:+ start:596 stop:937 length:342 start_codon:yes stop_codon:yes gene_type:complete